MAAARQILGQRSDLAVTKLCKCAGCKRGGTLRRLPPNFKCADVICDFCGYLVQVKAAAVAQLSPSFFPPLATAFRTPSGNGR